MANARPNSSGPDSSAGSSAGLPPLSGINKMDVLPEEWTLPHEWKIEKREPFAVNYFGRLSFLQMTLHESGMIHFTGSEAQNHDDVLSVRNWKLDVQSQISNISVSLNNSLKTYPHPEVGDGLTSVAGQEFEAWDEKRRQIQMERAAGTNMQLGLNRSATTTY